MQNRVFRQRKQIVRHDVITTVDQRPGTRRFDQRDAGARATTQLDRRMVASTIDQSHDVFEKRITYMDLMHGINRRYQLIRMTHWLIVNQIEFGAGDRATDLRDEFPAAYCAEKPPSPRPGVG